MSNVVIKAEHLSKMYRLGTINNGTLWKDIQTWTALKLGHEDPHSKIGEDKYVGDEDHFWALKNIDFEIHQGDRVGIIGKNGAGKSTLLKLLSRVTAPTEGVIKIKGKIASLLEVGTGFNGELTGRENIYLNGAILGMKKRQIDRKLDEIIDFSEIEHHIDTPVKRYSSGMYVRLAFAVAAHLDSDILIADEVLAVGDASFQEKALGKMQDLSKGQGRTVLFVSHNLLAVKRLCVTGMLLQNGTCAFNGELNIAYDLYNNINQKSNLANIVSLSDQQGNGSIIFQSIKKRNDTNQETNMFFFKSHLKLDVTIHFLQKTSNLYYYIAFIDLLTNRHTGCTGYVKMNEQIFQKNDDYTFSVLFPELLLPLGKYRMYIWIGDEFATKNPSSNYQILEDFSHPIEIISTINEEGFDGAMIQSFFQGA